MTAGRLLAPIGRMSVRKAAPLVSGFSIAMLGWLFYEHQVRRKAERLAAALLETLLNAIDANDPDTGHHVRRVAAYALILADAAGLDHSQMHVIERVALFHDIGKIHQALFDIIHDKRKLSGAERAAIASHPQKGADVLAPIAAFYPDLADGVVAHHERWDGSGYPSGLRGRDIPLSSRIVAIADTFDVVTHGRRYSAARSFSQGLAVIAEGAGSQFDPELAALFQREDVARCMEREMRRLREARMPASGGRRHGEREKGVPNVTFRWRPASPEPRERDPAHRG